MLKRTEMGFKGLEKVERDNNQNVVNFFAFVDLLENVSIKDRQKLHFFDISRLP